MPIIKLEEKTGTKSSSWKTIVISVGIVFLILYLISALSSKPKENVSQPEQQTQQQVVKYTTANVNLRGSGEEGILRVLPKGTKISVIEEQGEWTLVKVDNQQGWVLTQYLETEVEKIAREQKETSTQQPKSQSTDEETKKRISELEQKIKELQQNQQSYGQPSISTSLPTSDINKIVASVVNVICAYDSYGTFSEGSGTVWQLQGKSDYLIITNAHVVYNISGSPICGVTFPKVPSGEPYAAYRTEYVNMVWNDAVDIAILKLTTPIESQYALSYISTVTDYPFCDFSKVNIGDRVTIFGYPSSGGVSITVTEGNVSGFSGNDYKVSAGIIDSGNSGGAAFLNQSKCFLGIPTWVSKGEFSSVGLIQSWKTVVENFNGQ